jgi:hypothetical protein
MKNASDHFNEWYDSIGVRTYSKDHGSAAGHREYMAAAFLDGYHIALKQFETMLLNNDDTWCPEDDYNG